MMIYMIVVNKEAYKLSKQTGCPISDCKSCACETPEVRVLPDPPLWKCSQIGIGGFMLSF